MKFFIVISFFLTGCASNDVRSFFVSKIDCGNGWRSISERICEFENNGY